MKSGKVLVVLLAVLLAVPFLITNAGAAKWKLYDDFEGQTIDSTKWEKVRDGVVADITVEQYNGSWQAKFNYLQTTPDQSCWLKFNHSKWCPETIVGIKAKVTIEPDSSTNQQGKARIGFHPGTLDGYYLWAEIRQRSNKKYISGGGSLLDQDDNYRWIRDTLYGTFGYPDIENGKQYTMYAIFNKKDELTFGVEGLGETVLKHPGKFGDLIEIFKGIGIRISSGDGRPTNEKFVAYFDDVYVMTKGKCDKKAPKVKKTFPKKNAKKIDKNIDSITITFSEAMRGGWSYGISTYDGVSTPVWENQKTLQIVLEDPLDANTTYEVKLNPPDADPNFRDIKGNPLKPYNFKFTTGP